MIGLPNLSNRILLQINDLFLIPQTLPQVAVLGVLINNSTKIGCKDNAFSLIRQIF